MTIRTKTAAVLAALAAALVVVDAKESLIKIGTIAPDRSIYVTTLREMGEAWERRTNGRVTTSVYPGGDNTEEGLLREIRFKNLQVAQLSAITLGNLDDAFNVFGLPMFYESYAEADRVLEKLGPELETRLERKGYKALNWGYVGWVHIFSRKPVTTVDDLKRLKLYTSAGDDRLAKWYRANGFTAVPLDSTEIVGSLQTRMIEAVPSPPMFALLLTWYRAAPHMMDVGFAPLMGSTVMSLETFNRLTADDQKIVLEEAKKAGQRLRSEIPRQDREAIETMQRKGLRVTKVDLGQWRPLAERLGESMRRDGVVPGEIYDIAKRERDAARAGK